MYDWKQNILTKAGVQYSSKLEVTKMFLSWMQPYGDPVYVKSQKVPLNC